jgi:hypothetical protein
MGECGGAAPPVSITNQNCSLAVPDTAAERNKADV